MSKIVKEWVPTEREKVIGEFERNGFRVISEHDINGIEEDKAPRFAILYKYSKGKNYFVFVNVSRGFPCHDIVDISTQMIVIPKNHDIKMVARNKYFDAADEFGNIVHIEFEMYDDPISVMNSVIMFKK